MHEQSPMVGNVEVIVSNIPVISLTQDKYLALGHRPKFKLLPQLHAQGFSHVVTLLDVREGGSEIASGVRYAGMESVWVPLPNADIHKYDKATIDRFFEGVETVLANTEPSSYYVHCSAGIHRTGMFGYALLRRSNRTPEHARAGLQHMRPITAEGVTDARLNKVEELLGERALV